MMRQLFYSGPSLEQLHREVAKQGRIDENAPIRTQREIIINAPVEQVWQHLIDLPSWPTYSPAFRDVRLASTVAVDAKFQFTLHNFTIHATFAYIDPNRKLVWTGRSLWFNAVDLHELAPAPNGGTRYTIAESFAGVLATMFMSGEQLGKQHEAWQAAFKQAVEGKAVGEGSPKNETS